MESLNIEVLANCLASFARDREWDQFHTPKNLSMALAAEAGELLEIYQWLDADLMDQDTPEIRSRTAEELADILIYAIRMADVLDIDLAGAIDQKIESNRRRYPADEVKGSALKRE